MFAAPLPSAMGHPSVGPNPALRAASAAIRSAHERTGLFTRASIELYPHQLWVAQRVLSQWPSRMLVGDDVGLGKTIEAGLILAALQARGLVQRLLVLCPASLVEQWQERLRERFDIRAVALDGALERQRDFWQTHSQVIASFHRLRLDRPVGEVQRWDALAAAPPWDLVIVDEAHHLNADQDGGPTLGLQLLKRLDEASRLRGLLLFTGTPHRGKRYGFQSLLGLVDPAIEPTTPWPEVLKRLPNTMIRNNKRLCTDAAGRALFQPITTTTREFDSSPREQALYQRLSELVEQGRVFGGPGDGAPGPGSPRVGRSWLLLAIQKIATSSVAALTGALQTRKRELSRRADHEAALMELAAERASEGVDPDREAQLLLAAIRAPASPDERQGLDELLALAAAVTEEARVSAVLEVARSLPERETLLLFTEYKATQAAVVSRLAEEFGPHTVAFINGDGRLEGVTHGVGPYRALEMDRTATAFRFNRGVVRFLVSTEAAAEGIDLHESCCRLLHIDMPWNPMRLHQRVGRLDRIGQRRPIDVIVLRNRSLLDEMILSVFYRRIEEIQRAHEATMLHPESVVELVLGVVGDDPARALGSAAREALDGRWDADRAERWARALLPDSLSADGGLLQDIAVSAAAFPGGTDPMMSEAPPLAALIPFLRSAARAGGVTAYTEHDGSVTITPPRAWCDPAFAHFTLLRPRSQTLTFDRAPPAAGTGSILYGGPGNRLFDAALDWAERLPGEVAVLGGLTRTLVVFAALPEHLPARAAVRRVVVGAAQEAGGSWVALSDVAVLAEVNAVWSTEPTPSVSQPVPRLPDLEGAHAVTEREARRLGVPWDRFVLHVVSVLIPG